MIISIIVLFLTKLNLKSGKIYETTIIHLQQQRVYTIFVHAQGMSDKANHPHAITWSRNITQCH